MYSGYVRRASEGWASLFHHSSVSAGTYCFRAQVLVSQYESFLHRERYLGRYWAQAAVLSRPNLLVCRMSSNQWSMELIYVFLPFQWFVMSAAIVEPLSH